MSSWGGVDVNSVNRDDNSKAEHHIDKIKFEDEHEHLYSYRW